MNSRNSLRLAEAHSAGESATTAALLRCRALLILTLPHHCHQAVLDGSGCLRWLQAQRKSLVEAVALIDEIFSSRTVFFARRFELLQLLRLQRADDVKPGAILEFLKAHPSTPSNCRRFFSSLIRDVFLPYPKVYSYEPRFRAGSCPEKM